MSRWEWHHTFSVDVPDGWQIRELPGLVELTPPANNGALHISVLERTSRGPVAPEEAPAILEAFAAQQSMHEAIVVALPDNAAETEFMGRSGTEQLAWVVRVQVSRSRAVRASFCNDRDDSDLREKALEVIRSIAVIERA